MLDGFTVASGAIDGNGIQVGKQFAEICAISSYSFVVSAILLLLMKYIPGLHLRVSEEAEELGLDMDQFFDEQIGDWSYLEHVEKTRNTATIIGQQQTVERPSGISSSEDRAHEKGQGSEDAVKTA